MCIRDRSTRAPRPRRWRRSVRHKPVRSTRCSVPGAAPMSSSTGCSPIESMGCIGGSGRSLGTPPPPLMRVLGAGPRVLFNSSRARGSDRGSIRGWCVCGRRGRWCGQWWGAWSCYVRLCTGWARWVTSTERWACAVFFLQSKERIGSLVRSRGLGDVYKSKRREPPQANRITGLLAVAVLPCVDAPQGGFDAW